ncbi:hypothetical protein V2G26_020211 [Clonostachys chloroleuca]|uniref:Uncharacterized protein n=1 Tax=Clonostachys chloroleuca TaxID=1926264 RepID=A0AA35PZW9_9HYPO|nr:unnamed protein product [Clonostachys chloroleuca]
MSHTYKSDYPSDLTTDPEIVQFFEDFYKTSDTPGAHDKYVDLFTKDAQFVLASKRSVGHDEITTTRHGMWTAVASRKHTIPKIFPFGNGTNEFMLYGSVALGLKNGIDAEVDWAARAQVVKSSSDGKWRMSFYQVYLDTGATAAYAKK